MSMREHFNQRGSTPEDICARVRVSDAVTDYWGGSGGQDIARVTSPLSPRSVTT